MQHLSEEQLVEHYYHDDVSPAAAEQHLRDCAGCAKQYSALRQVLSMVSGAEVPERGETYGTEVWQRLRWKLGSEKRRRRGWQSSLAAAAVLLMVFLAGRYWSRFNDAPQQIVANAPTQTTAPVATPVAIAPNEQAQERLLLIVVSDHLDTSARMLMEVANADVKEGLPAEATQRAEDLVASNRIYRQTAARHGDARVAAVLSDIEPILVELKNAGTSLSGEKLAQLQQRIESKGLLFKVRVINAQGGDVDQPPPVAPTTKSNSL